MRIGNQRVIDEQWSPLLSWPKTRFTAFDVASTGRARCDRFPISLRVAVHFAIGVLGWAAIFSLF